MAKSGIIRIIIRIRISINIMYLAEMPNTMMIYYVSLPTYMYLPTYLPIYLSI